MNGIVLIASDTAPTKALGMVADELRSRGEIVTLLSGPEKPLVSAKTTLVLSGMAHNASAAEPELNMLRQAIGRNIRIGLYADTFDCAGRPWFADVRNHTEFLFTPNETEAEKAVEFFPEAIITATGNPIWQASGFPTTNRTGVRKRLGLRNGQVAIFCPLRKETGINNEHLELLGKALTRLPSDTRDSMFVIVGVHPGDSGFKNDPSIYQKVLPPQSQIVSGIPTRDVLPGINLVVNAASGAGIDAIYQRVPVIEVLTSTVLDEVERLHRRRVWQPVEDGAATAVDTADQLCEAIEAALNLWSDRSAAFELMQKKHYPLPAHPDQAVKKMADLIQQYMLKP